LVERHSNSTVHMSGSLLAGHGLVDSTRWTAASLLPDMLERGTSARSRIELAQLLEDRGIDLDVSSDGFNPVEVHCGGRCLARDLPLFLDVLVDMLRRPSFPPEELEKLRTLRLGELAHSQEDTFVRAFDAFGRAVFPPGHPYWRRPLEERRMGLEQVDRDSLVETHGELFGAGSLVLALVGDFDARELLSRLSEHLGADPGPGRAISLPARRSPGDVEPRTILEFMPDKPSADVLIGHPGGLLRADGDYIAAQLGNAVLGMSTLSSRLGKRVRDGEGLTYGITSRFFGASLVDGPWAVHVTVAPSNLERAVAVIHEEIARYVDEGPTETELDDERSAMAGSYRVGLATPGGLARELARLARHGLPASELDHIPERILGTSRDEVKSAVTRHLAPGHLVVAAAGELVANPSSAD
jgi:zinc protease